MSEFVWYKDGKEFQRSKDIEGKFVTKKITGVDSYVVYKYYDDGGIYTEEYYKNDQLHREGDKPARISYYEDGSIRYEAHYKNGGYHRDGDKPAYIGYNNGNVDYEKYFKNDKEHRDDDKPAHIEYNEDGIIYHETYYKNGVEYKPNKNKQ